VSLAVVLGGGGSAGVAWEVGVLHGLAEEGVDLRGATTYVGTSAGAVVAVRLLAATGTAELYAEACRPVDATLMELDYPALEARWAAAAAGATSATDARARIGALALAADTMTPQARRAEIAALLPVHEWPEGRLLVTAVGVADGEAASFDRGSAVDLVDAVGASCAVPGVWPPVVVHGAAYMDGAVRSTTNADLAAGHDRVVVLAPLPPLGGLARELGRLPEGTTSVAVEADAAAVAAFGSNPLDPRTGPAAAVEGRRQGRERAAEIGELLRG
jgi:NTE family protein